MSLLCSYNLDPNSMSLILDPDLDILKMHLRIRNEDFQGFQKLEPGHVTHTHTQVTECTSMPH